ncbi:unnamed protein product, partial [Pylaiella littoralis]
QTSKGERVLLLGQVPSCYNKHRADDVDGRDCGVGGGGSQHKVGSGSKRKGAANGDGGSGGGNKPKADGDGGSGGGSKPKADGDGGSGSDDGVAPMAVSDDGITGGG